MTAFPVGHLSWSSVSLYSECPACWAISYLERRPRRVTPALIVGAAVHGALWALRTAREADAAVEAARAAAGDSLMGIDRTGELPDSDPLLDLGSKFSSWSAVEDEYLRLIPDLAPIIEAERGYDVVAVEDELFFPPGTFSVPLVGYADVVIRRDGQTVLKDAKSSAKDSPPDANAWRQLALYTLAVGTDFVGVDQIVKTKSVTVHPWTDEGYSGTVSAALRASVIAQVEYAADGIRRGDFPVLSGRKYGCDFPHPSVVFSVPAEAVA